LLRSPQHTARPRRRAVPGRCRGPRLTSGCTHAQRWFPAAVRPGSSPSRRRSPSVIASRGRLRGRDRWHRVPCPRIRRTRTRCSPCHCPAAADAPARAHAMGLHRSAPCMAAIATS
jgi:hypothetical protein